ncbi:MAG TPA: hypothetical protein VMX13_00760 [Sedimentisphaerales bacterium]|nr:hypothetical protein [Sedimentisphaerales bacterium]
MPKLKQNAGKPCVIQVKKTFELWTPGPVRIEDADYIGPASFGELKALSLSASVEIPASTEKTPTVMLRIRNDTKEEAKFIAAQLTVIVLVKGKSELFTAVNGTSCPHNLYSGRYVRSFDIKHQTGRIRIRNETWYDTLEPGEEYSCTVELKLSAGEYYVWGGYGASNFFGPISLMSNGVHFLFPKPGGTQRNVFEPNADVSVGIRDPEPNQAPLEKLPYPLPTGMLHRRNIAIEFEGPLPELPTEMMVYKVKEPNITEEFVYEFAKEHFAIERTAEMSGSSGLTSYRLRGKNWVLQVYAENGALILDDPLMLAENMQAKRLFLEEKGSDYPSEDECRAIAEQFLTDHNLLPQDAYFRSVADSRASIDAISVSFHREINGYKEWGAGAKLFVRVWPEGRVVQVFRLWQQLEPYKVYPLKPIAQALEELRNGKVIWLSGSKGTIRNISLRYHSSTIPQEYVQPLYYFECEGADEEFYGVVPAIKDEYLKSKEETLQEEKARKAEGGKGGITYRKV